jgi:hypothetical protein
MHALVVVPADGFHEYTPKLPFIPDQHAETLPAKRPYQPLDVRCRLGCTVWVRYPPNPTLPPEPPIVCGSTPGLLSCILHWKPTTELTELPVVVVEQELGLLPEAGDPGLWFRPLEGRMTSYVPVDDLSIRQHQDND